MCVLLHYSNCYPQLRCNPHVEFSWICSKVCCSLYMFSERRPILSLKAINTPQVFSLCLMLCGREQNRPDWHVSHFCVTPTYSFRFKSFWDRNRRIAVSTWVSPRTRKPCLDVNDVLKVFVVGRLIGYNVCDQHKITRF